MNTKHVLHKLLYLAECYYRDPNAKVVGLICLPADDPYRKKQLENIEAIRNIINLLGGD